MKFPSYLPGIQYCNPSKQVEKIHNLHFSTRGGKFSPVMTLPNYLTKLYNGSLLILSLFYTKYFLVWESIIYPIYLGSIIYPTYLAEGSIVCFSRRIHCLPNLPDGIYYLLYLPGRGFHCLPYLPRIHYLPYLMSRRIHCLLWQKDPLFTELTWWDLLFTVFTW
jgi:hypothetical protein